MQTEAALSAHELAEMLIDLDCGQQLRAVLGRLIQVTLEIEQQNQKHRKVEMNSAVLAELDRQARTQGGFAMLGPWNVESKDSEINASYQGKSWKQSARRALGHGKEIYVFELAKGIKGPVENHRIAVADDVGRVIAFGSDLNDALSQVH